jgi:hypothetical protein
MVACSWLLLLLIMGTIIFLNEPKNSINRKARISKTKVGDYWIVNANMPYQGTLNKIWTKETLLQKIKNKEVKVEGIEL